MDRAGLYRLICGLGAWNLVVITSVASGGISLNQAPAVLGAIYVAAAIYLSHVWKDAPHPAAYAMMYLSGFFGLASIFASESAHFGTLSYVGAEIAIFAAILKLIDDRKRVVAKERLNHHR
jgi:threonine/homoserine/homoserine lactone efflux protein